MSMRIVPGNPAASSSQHVISHKDTAHPESGVHDAFRYGLKPAAAAVQAGNSHPLQARLEQWEATQTALKMTMQRNTYGLGLPMRNMMDKKICAEDPHFPALLNSNTSLGGSSNISLEILNGTDETIDAGDFMAGDALPKEIMDIHSAMEKKYRM